MQNSKAFTIVELLIVIVVIGILAAIVVVAYNGIRDRADNMARLSELKSWSKAYKQYKILHSELPGAGDPNLKLADDPATPDSGYCLGVGFPNADASSPDGYCRSPNGGSLQYKPNSYINDQIKTISSLPSGPRTIVKGSQSLGPFVRYYDNGDGTYWVMLTDVFNGYECPDGTKFDWKFSGQNAVMCGISINRK